MAKDYLYCEETDTKLYSGDVISISSYSDVKFIIKKGWYKLGTAQKNGWYVVNISTRNILPIEVINITEITKDVEQGTSETRPTVKDIDTSTIECNFIVIPGTNIRIYDGDIVKISNRPRLKWIAHAGWFIYDDAQNFGWYFECIKNGEILPVSIVDLTLVVPETIKTQGSGIYDGKVVNYTRPFTVADAELLNRTFITLDTIEQRDNIDTKKLINGRIVRVNDVGGAPAYYIWNATIQEWEPIETHEEIPEVIGTTEDPIILCELTPGLYRVKGTYKISRSYEMISFTPIDHIAFVSAHDLIDIKVITQSEIIDYQVDEDTVVLVNPYSTYKYLEENYATILYVDNAVAVLEAEIAEIIETFHDKVVLIVNQCLHEALNSIDEDYIDDLFEQ